MVVPPLDASPCKTLFNVVKHCSSHELNPETRSASQL